MSSFLIDACFLYAVLDKDDSKHQEVVDVLSSLSDDDIVLLAPVIVETAYLLLKRIGHHAVRDFIEAIEPGCFRLECVEQSDISRISEILKKYSDAKLDFADAAITALAERLCIRQILTIDQKDFRMIVPKHCDYFEILPSQ